MRTLVLLAALAPITAAAEPTAPPVNVPRYTFAASVYHNDFPTIGVNLAAAYRLRGSQYLDAQVSVGDRVYNDGYASIFDQHVWSAQVGTSAITWTPHLALGARASAGFLRMEVKFAEALIADEPWVEDYDSIYAEGAAFMRIRMGDNVALDLQIAVRFHAPFDDKTDAFMRGAPSVGLVVAF